MSLKVIILIYKSITGFKVSISTFKDILERSSQFFDFKFRDFDIQSY